MEQQVYINPEIAEWSKLCKRPAFDYSTLNEIVQPILLDVKENGDAAVRKYAEQFDHVKLDNLWVTKDEMVAAALTVPEELKAAIQVAVDNISRFHLSQVEQPQVIETATGVYCWRKSVGIQNVGLYIPGGTAPLFSTLLMLAIPAKIAGCKNIIVSTPTNSKGEVNPIVLYAARLLGLTKIYKAGGVQAIAAMAFGTETMTQAYKIFGPGNQYVTAAKQLVNSMGTAIDMPAGPSELAVYADETSNPAFIASDLLSQAEHGADSQVVLLASSASLVSAVQGEIDQQLQSLPRASIASQALKNSRFIVMDEPANAFAFLNVYAPEHLIIASDHATDLAEKVLNAGSVFLGNYSPESAGDYASGTNHTLPTNGYAKAYSGVSVDSFVKKITFQQLSPEGIKLIGPAIEAMAEAEGLQAHKNAVSIRLSRLKKITSTEEQKIDSNNG